jgi:hypothetical protein
MIGLQTSRVNGAERLSSSPDGKKKLAPFARVGGFRDASAIYTIGSAVTLNAKL